MPKWHGKPQGSTPICGFRKRHARYPAGLLHWHRSKPGLGGSYLNVVAPLARSIHSVRPLEARVPSSARGRGRAAGRASHAAPQPSGGVPCDARLHGPSRNSLRELRSLRSNTRAECEHEARCVRGREASASRRRIGPLPAARPRPWLRGWFAAQRELRWCLAEDGGQANPGSEGGGRVEGPGGGHGRIRLPTILGSLRNSEVGRLRCSCRLVLRCNGLRSGLSRPAGRCKLVPPA